MLENQLNNKLVEGESQMTANWFYMLAGDALRHICGKHEVGKQ